MNVIWYKVWRDLAHNGLRTTLVVLSIAAGVFALGVVFGAREAINDHLARENRFTQPANITFRGDRLGRQTLEAALREPGVVGVELETIVPIRWRLPEETEWRPGVVVARPDYSAQQVNRIELLAGRWPGESTRPQEKDTLAVERQTSRHLDVPLDTSIVIESRPGELASIGGVVRKPYVGRPSPNDPAIFYATPETVARLTGVRDSNKLHVRLASGVPEGRESIDGTRKRVEDRLERMGLSVSGFTTVGAEDGVPADWLASVLEALFLILGVLGIALLGLSAFLIVNTMNAVIVQQVWQIGMMKVLGATSWRVMRVYLSVALVYGVLALLPAIPLGAVSAHAMASWLLDTFNIIAPVRLRVSPIAMAVQVLMALAVALLAAALPVIGGARISPHQAISTYGLGGRFGRGPLDRLVGQIRFLPRPMALSLRNVFRRKVRVSLTLVTFVFVGVMFIAVLSAHSSIHRSIEVMLRSFPHDVMVALPRYYRANRLVEITEGTPGVVRTEVWDRVYADLSLTTGKKEIMVFGVPPDSEVFRIPIVAGRYLLPGEGRAILLDSKTAIEEGIGIGDEVTLTVAGRESTWTVVGLIQDVSPDPNRDSAVPFDALTQEAGHAGRGNTVIVISEIHDAPSRARLAAALGDAYVAERIETTSLTSADELSRDTHSAFDTLSYLLLAMAFLAAVVGSIGLVGTLSINVVERMREVGVMRAIGAVSSDILWIFVGEGVFLGVLSWLLAAPLSYPGAYYLNKAIGSAFNLPVAFEYSFPSVAIWLVLVIVLSAMAGMWPARRATRITVHKALAYE